MEEMNLVNSLIKSIFIQQFFFLASREGAGLVLGTGETGLVRGRPFPVQKPQCLVCDLSMTEFQEGGAGGRPRGRGVPGSLLSAPSF